MVIKYLGPKPIPSEAVETMKLCAGETTASAYRYKGVLFYAIYKGLKVVARLSSKLWKVGKV